MKNSFEWKKDIEYKVTEKKERIAYRNKQLRSLASVSLAVMLCVGCSVAVVRFSRINKPATEYPNDGIMTAPSYTGNLVDETTAANSTDYGVMTVPSFPDRTDEPAFTADRSDTELPEYTAATPDFTEMDTEYPMTHPIYTDYDPYATVTTCPPDVGTPIDTICIPYFTEISEKISSAPLKIDDDKKVIYRKTLKMALEYYGLSEFSLPLSMVSGGEYLCKPEDGVDFIALKTGDGTGEIIVRDVLSVWYASNNTPSEFELSIGKECAPYDWTFEDEGIANYAPKGIEIKLGQINGDNNGADLLVADFTYNGLKFRFTGYDSSYKDFVIFLNNIIDGLFVR